MANNNLECPVDFVLVNENKARLTALSVFLLAAAYALTTYWIFAAFLVIDFFLRALNFGKYSLLNLLSDVWIRLFSIKNKPIDRAPKTFAAQIGFLLIYSIFILHSFGQVTIALYLNAVLLLFSFLESAFGFCAGCYAYTFLKKFFPFKTVKNDD